jgi:hypothetical protein
MVYHMVIGQGLLVLFTEKNQHMLVRTIATFLAALMGTASSTNISGESRRLV